MTYQPDPADAPQPGDPPVNAESMIEVLRDFLIENDERQTNAVRLIALYAIRAVLDGGDIRSIASSCGFTDESAEEAGAEAVDAFLDKMGIPPQMRNQFTVANIQAGGGPDPICAFHVFLNDALKEFIHDQADLQVRHDA